MEKRYLEILSNKPELMSDFPEWMLPESRVNEIREIADIAIAEIAGRDSIAAVIQACELRHIQAIIPTIAYTGTEYGNWDLPFEKIKELKDRLQKKMIKIFDPVILGSPKFWWTLCGRYISHLFKTLEFYSPCLGCHLYFHAIRIPIAKKLHCKLIIGGERESHDGKIKINQIGISLDAYINLLKRFDIELFLPIRNIESGKEVESIVGQQWDEGDQQLECVLSKNYQEFNGSVILNEKAIKRFFKEFAQEKAEKSIKKYLTN
jgi:hypothetical protein